MQTKIGGITAENRGHRHPIYEDGGKQYIILVKTSTHRILTTRARTDRVRELLDLYAEEVETQENGKEN